MDAKPKDEILKYEMRDDGCSFSPFALYAVGVTGETMICSLWHNVGREVFPIVHAANAWLEIERAKKNKEE